MKALVLSARGVLALEERPLPEPRHAGSLLIRVRHAGICGSDLHRAFGGGAYHYPLVMGHELSGVVERAFPGSKHARGDRVAVFPLIPCHRCDPCQTGAYAQCESYDYLGSRSDGGFAEYLWAPEEGCFPVPEGVELMHAALTEPAAVALHGVRRLRLRGGESAAVFGGGPIGNLAAQWLRILGCASVAVVEPDPRKLELARVMGFLPIDPRGTDPVAALKEASGGRGPDRVVEACGLPLTYLQAVQSASRSGEVVFLGNIRGDFTLPEKEVSSLLRRELTLYGTWNSGIVPRGTDDWSTALRFMRKGLEVAPLVTHTPALGEGPDIFRRMAAGAVPFGESFGKVVFVI